MPSWIVSLPDRLDSFLSKDGRMLSRAKAQKAVEEGLVSVNDEPAVKASQRLQEGDKVELRADEEEDNAVTGVIEPADLKLTILYEDAACLVIDKPAGLAVHPGAGMAPDEKTLLHGIAGLFKKKKWKFFSDGVLVHRLDRETTGCILIAKTREAHAALQEQFQHRTVKKIYLAIVAGVPDPPAAVIDAPVGRSVRDRTKMAILGTSAPREAQTTYRTIDRAKNAALLACELHTGRTHQIRVHLSSLGHPILGDSDYGSELGERIAQEHDIRGLCLHARELTFRSPADNEEHTVTAPLPASFEDALHRLGLRA